LIPNMKNPLAKVKEMDLTKGNLFLKIGIFALPMALTTIMQLLYTTVDLISVHFWGNGQSSAGAISANGSLINLVIVVFTSLSLGANVAIGNAKGAGDHEHALKVLHTSLLFALITGICVGAAGFFAAESLLRLIKTEEAYLENARTYMQIYFVGLPLLMLYNYGAQMHRAVGNSTTPFLALLFAGLINVLFDFVFVYYCGLDVKGVAWATVISEGISSLLVIIPLFFKSSGFLHCRFKDFRIDRESLGEIIKLGLPAGLQGFFFALPNTFIQSALYSIAKDMPNSLDVEDGAIAANTINNYCYACVEAISAACLAVTAQNYGARNKQNIVKAFVYAQIWNLIFNFFYSLLILVFHNELLSLFVDKDNAVSLQAGWDRLMVVGFTYVLDGIMDVSSSSMRGVRHSTTPMWVTMLTCTLFRIAMIEGVILRVDYFKTVFWLYSVFPLSWILADIADLICLRFAFKKEFAKIDEGKASAPIYG
jgi:putative MATE family efflux protein